MEPGGDQLIDGRLEVFGIERRLELNARLPRDFEALDRRYRFELALLNFGQIDYTRLLRHLHRSEDWALVFVDDVAAVFQRRTADRSPDEVDLDDPRLLADAGMERGIGDAYRARGRIRFFRAIGRADRAREIAREMVARYPELRRQAER